MAQDVSLTAGMRSNLLSLQNASNLLDRTQSRLSTGKKVETALDDPVAFFTAKGHTDRASDLQGFKDGMAEAVQNLKAADQAISSITDLLKQAQGLVKSARQGDTDERAELSTQLWDIMSQIDTMAQDAFYGGKNLLSSGDNLTVDFGEDHSLTVNATAIAGSMPFSVDTSENLNTESAINDVDNLLEAAVSGLRTESSKFSTNLTIITSREDFTSGMINTLQEGADNLTLADMNEEGANMLMLQTRQQLGTTALSMSAQAAQAVLRLF
jgi:flagellin-like hook-associated protein FlgL